MGHGSGGPGRVERPSCWVALSSVIMGDTFAKLDLLAAATHHLPPVSRQAAQTRIAALRASFLALAAGGGGRP